MLVVRLKQEVNWPVTVKNDQKRKFIILKLSILIGQFAYCLNLTTYVSLHANDFTMPLLERLSIGICVIYETHRRLSWPNKKNRPITGCRTPQTKSVGCESGGRDAVYKTPGIHKVAVQDTSCVRVARVRSPVKKEARRTRCQR